MAAIAAVGPKNEGEAVREVVTGRVESGEREL
jgi:hypothetical protein